MIKNRKRSIATLCLLAPVCLTVALSPAQAQEVGDLISIEYDASRSGDLVGAPSADALLKIDQALAEDALAEPLLGPDEGPAYPDKYTVKTDVRYLRPWGPGWLSLRWGWSDGAGKGFGWRKVSSYHNIRDERALRYLTQGDYWTSTGGKSFRGLSYAIMKACSRRTGQCQEVERIPVITVVDEALKSDNRNMGVVTAFCDGYWPQCPDWVSPTLASKYNGT